MYATVTVARLADPHPIRKSEPPPLATTIHRQQRCQALLVALPIYGSGRSGRTVEELLELLADGYRDCASLRAKIRAMQRDLRELTENDEIVTERPPRAGMTLYHWRARPAMPSFKNVHLNNLYADLVTRNIDTELAADFVRRVQHPALFFGLPSEQFLAVPDTVRLQPMRPPDDTIRNEIMIALRERRVLSASYKKLDATEPTPRKLHLVGILQRGPQYYVVGYDDAKLVNPDPPVQMYLLQRFHDAVALEDPANPPAGVSLQELALKKGLADFARDAEPTEVQLKVRGYVRSLLEDTRLSDDQTITPTVDKDCVIVTASVLLSGTLYRWILGFGDKVEVLAPLSLRRTIVSQARAIVGIYARSRRPAARKSRTPISKRPAGRPSPTT